MTRDEKQSANKNWAGLHKEMATPSSILAWRAPWTEEPAGYSPWDRKELTRLSD